MPATPDDLFALLERLGMATTTMVHEAVFTVEESEKVTAQIPGGHTKNLFVKDRKDNYYLIIAEQVARLDMNRLHPVIGARGRLSFGKPEPMMEFLGIEPGSVTAFCVMNDHGNRVRVIIDEPLLEHDRINCHPLTNTMTTTISRDDLLRFLKETGHEPLVLKLSGERAAG